MVEIEAAKRPYPGNEISNVALIKSKFNIADSLTKFPGNNDLRKLLEARKWTMPSNNESLLLLGIKILFWSSTLT